VLKFPDISVVVVGHQEPGLIRRAVRALPVALVIMALPMWWAYTVLTAQTDDALRAQRPAWERCPGSIGVAECAVIKVPLDHRRPEERWIDLALVRLPARHPDERIGSLVMNFGGPGVAGTAALLADPEPFNTLRARYDLVAFDPRGVGESTPLNCRPGGQPLPYLSVDQTPDTPAERETLVKVMNEYAAACRRQAGWLLPYLTTDATARDLDILRSALGEPELSFLGYSYGGGLGAAYAHLYPGKVRRMVLDAPSSDTGGGPFISDFTGADEPYETFVLDCVKRRGCPLGRDADAGVQRLQDLVALRDGLPLEVRGGKKLTDALAIEGVTQLIYRTDDWPRLRRALADALDGDGQALYDAAMALEEGWGLSRDAYTAITCNDTLTRSKPEDLAETAEAAHESAPISGAWAAWGLLRCQGWDTVDGTAWLTDPPRQLSAIMVVGTTGDPIVPYDAVTEVRSTLSDSVLVSLRGNSHTAYRSGNRCVNKTVEAYLLDGVLPTDDVMCTAAGTRKKR
jgi:pimeloyl-ACP methyl ester carboxylesterase